MTDASSSEEPKEIEDNEVRDPTILILATNDKEPPSHRLTSVIEGEKLIASRAEVPQLTTPMPLRRGASLRIILLDDGRESEMGRVS